MGNINSVTGLSPCASARGALLRVRRGAEEAFLAAARSMPTPNYVEITRATLTIAIDNLCVPMQVPDRAHEATYVVIRSGGKWGYGGDLEAYIEALAPFMDDARFLLDDENTDKIAVWTITAGRLEIDRFPVRSGESDAFILDRLAGLPSPRLEWLRQRAESEWIPELALRYVDEALAEAPEDAELLRLRGCCLARLGQLDEARQTLRDAIAALPEHRLRSHGARFYVPEGVPMRGPIAEALKTIHAALGEACARGGALEEALEHYARSHAIHSNSERVDGLDGQCVVALQLHRSELAEPLIDELVRLAPRRPSIARAYHLRACLRALQQRLDEAERDLERALELDPHALIKFRRGPLLEAVRTDDFIALLGLVSRWRD